jgi:hypothetical protein
MFMWLDVHWNGRREVHVDGRPVEWTTDQTDSSNLFSPMDYGREERCILMTRNAHGDRKSRFVAEPYFSKSQNLYGSIELKKLHNVVVFFCLELRLSLQPLTF